MWKLIYPWKNGESNFWITYSHLKGDQSWQNGCTKFSLDKKNNWKIYHTKTQFKKVVHEDYRYNVINKIIKAQVNKKKKKK